MTTRITTRLTIRQWLIAALCGLLGVIGVRQVTQAQGGQELLSNNNMQQYYGIGGANVVPVGWTLSANIAVSSTKQRWQYTNQQYDGSWNVSASQSAFTMTAYQFVPGVRSGTPLRFSVAANIFTCNKKDSCIENGLSYRVSDQSSGSKVRIGIDPTGGKDPNAGSVVWSGFTSPWDSFQVVTVDSASQNDNGVTVFLYATQSVPMLLNDVYWDNASLVALGAGGVPVGPGTNAPPPPTVVPAGVPFVTPQGAQPDGSIIHIVSAGDTLSSIAYAYKVTIKQLRDLNNIAPDSGMISPGQKLIIKPPTVGSGIAVMIVTATWTPGPGTSIAPPTSQFGAVPLLLPSFMRTPFRVIATAGYPPTIVPGVSVGLAATPVPTNTATPRPSSTPTETPPPTATKTLIPPTASNTMTATATLTVAVFTAAATLRKPTVTFTPTKLLTTESATESAVLALSDTQSATQNATQNGVEVLILSTTAPATAQATELATQPVTQLATINVAEILTEAAILLSTPGNVPSKTQNATMSATLGASSAATNLATSQPTEAATLAFTAAPTDIAINSVADTATTTATDLATAEATIAATNTATETPTDPPTVTATIDATATNDMTATAAIRQGTGICGTVFEDANQNRIKDADENLLAGIPLRVNQGDKTVNTVQTNDQSAICVVNLDAGIYTVSIDPPPGYALTTSGQFVVEIKPNVKINLTFGVARGLQPTANAQPTIIAAPGDKLPSSARTDTTPNDLLGKLLDSSGLLVLGMAGVIFFGGIGLVMIIRRG